MKRLYRSETNTMVAGVLGGLGEYFRMDPTILRLLFVVVLFMSFFTVAVIYLVAAVIIPAEGEIR
ncbi:MULTISPECIES: PspC domain-containing protein [Clostridia]|uniref:PspC domain-containing protein n=1 Tax=Clostridia TaxID=186801 RepID=UPI000EA015CA|nr:PspC domain-containing protein [Roseburia sp. 1XD42-34]RKI78321.1 PspC domain-containing protein [Clostridium sp. 1xD42-85]